MYYQFSFMLALLLVIIAGVTVLIMLEMGNSGQDKSWTALHRLLGYLFLMLFAAMLAYMVFRVGSFQEDAPTPVMILALLLVPLIMIKIVVARQKAHISTKLMLLGMAIFGLSFGLTGMAAYYYNKQHSGRRMLSAGEQSMEIGQVIMSKKCSKCHTLERIYTAAVADWTPTVNKMAAFDSSNISSSEAGAITSYLNQQAQLKIKDKMEQGRKLLVAKCSTCHSLEKVYVADMDEEHWRKTVEKMIKIDGNSMYLSEEQKQLIVNFLSSRRAGRSILSKESTPPGGDDIRSLVIRKCSAGCHAADRFLHLQKTREEWRDTVNSMVEITGNPDYLSAEEKEQIIDFLTLPPNQRGKKQEARPKSTSANYLLITSKCGACHTVDRVYQAKKNKVEWTKTISSMVQGTGNPNYLSEQEKRDIVDLMSNWEVIE